MSNVSSTSQGLDAPLASMSDSALERICDVEPAGAASMPSITAAHLERLAVVYVRQSSIAQVREHTESTARQYALAQEAARLGWSAGRISVIDADLGVSGRTASARSRFKELVGRVCVGEVGAILGGLDEDRDFADLMLDAWLRTTEASRAEAFDALGHRLQGAREHHDSAKALDDALFGEDFETA